AISKLDHLGTRTIRCPGNTVQGLVREASPPLGRGTIDSLRPARQLPSSADRLRSPNPSTHNHRSGLPSTPDRKQKRKMAGARAPASPLCERKLCIAGRTAPLGPIFCMLWLSTEFQRIPL